MSSLLVPFSRTYDETLEMMIEARNYIAYAIPSRYVKARERSDLRFCCEAFRVTSRLTQVMAWLMVQRAAQEGEITQAEACGEENRLSGEYVCLDTKGGEDHNLPDGLRSLLDRSYRLYRRVSRLEEMVLTRRGMNDNEACADGFLTP